MGLIVSRSGSAGSSNPYAIADADLPPWHFGAGNYGPQVAITPPTLPVTSGNPVLVATVAEFESAATVSGRIIQFTASVAEDAILDFTADDLDIIVPSGIVVGGFEGDQNRIRIRGETPGSHSGGRCGQIRVNGDDLCIDGLDINSSSNAGSEAYQGFRLGGNRHGIYNCRAVAPAYMYQGGVVGLIIKSCNFYSGAWTRAQVMAASGDSGYDEGWNIRFTGGPLTIIDSDLRTTRFHVVRCHTVTGTTKELLFLKRDRLVGIAEKKTVWAWRDSDTNGDGPGEGFVMEDCEIYGHSDCNENAEVSITNPNGDPCAYSRVRNNDFFSSGNGADYSQAALDTQDALTGDHDWSVGNTFSAWTVYPSYDMNSTGDPEDIPLPGLTNPLSYGEGSCVGFPDS